MTYVIDSQRRLRCPLQEDIAETTIFEPEEYHSFIRQPSYDSNDYLTIREEVLLRFPSFTLDPMRMPQNRRSSSRNRFPILFQPRQPIMVKQTKKPEGLVKS